MIPNQKMHTTSHKKRLSKWLRVYWSWPIPFPKNIQPQKLSAFLHELFFLFTNTPGRLFEARKTHRRFFQANKIPGVFKTPRGQVGMSRLLAFCACETLKGLMTRETPGSHHSWDPRPCACSLCMWDPTRLHDSWDPVISWLVRPFTLCLLSVHTRP